MGANSAHRFSDGGVQWLAVGNLRVPQRHCGGEVLEGPLTANRIVETTVGGGLARGLRNTVQ